MKVLTKVGLIKKQRRGKMQSNIYQAVELTDQIIKCLNRPHKYILEDIAREDEKARKMREVKRELNNRKFIHPRRQKVASDQSYPQKSEVQLMDSKEALQASLRCSSNRNNDSKI